MSYDKLVLDTANELNIKVEYIQAISTVYDLISRFAGFTIEDVNNLVVERAIFGKNRMNNYENIPIHLKNKVISILKTKKDIGLVFCPYKKQKNFKQFCKKFLEQKQQPKDYFFSGCLTYKSLMFNINENKTYDIKEVSYK